MAASKLATADRILRAAAALFYSRGFRSVSVDAVAEHAGLTKMTVYQHFRSKEEMLIECLRLRLHRREDVLDALLATRTDPVDALLAIFDWLEEKVEEPGFFGCAFLKAANELGDDVPLVREIARESKDRMQARLRGLAVAAGLGNAEEIGEEIAVLFEGAQVLSLVQGSDRPVAVARRAALALVSNARDGRSG